MNLRNWGIKGIAIVILMAFCLMTGCAGIFNSEGGRVPLAAVRTAPTSPPTIVVEPAPAKPLKKEIIKKGQVATMDGILFDKESTKIILGDLAEYRQLKVKVQIQEQIIKAYSDQAQLLRESNSLQMLANQELRKEIESKRKWDTIKNWGSVLGAVAAFALGIWAGK